ARSIGGVTPRESERDGQVKWDLASPCVGNRRSCDSLPGAAGPVRDLPARGMASVGDGAYAPPVPVGRGYRRREPERTLLHATVRGHFKFLAEVEHRGDRAGLPGFVVSEFERYLGCGILANGFARVRCASCHDEILVAFSCKGRGFCPSCTTRRMQGTAMHLLDRVLPRVPMRQWVLSLPRWTRFLLARDPRLVTRALEVALRGIFGFWRRRARQAGAREPRTGAVSFVQR